MRKIWLALLMVVGFSGAAMATPVALPAVSGTFLGLTNGDNDPFPDPFMGSPALYKCDGAGTGDCTDVNGPGTLNYSAAFNITFDPKVGNEFKSGTWSFTAAGAPLLPTKLVIKAGNGFAAYDISKLVYVSGVVTGVWSTVDLESKGVSHISFYDGALTPVPLPAAGWLLIAGVGALAALRRRNA